MSCELPVSEAYKMTTWSGYCADCDEGVKDEVDAVGEGKSSCMAVMMMEDEECLSEQKIGMRSVRSWGSASGLSPRVPGA